MVQSGKRRLRGDGIERETTAKAGDSLQTASLYGVVLGIEQAVCNHIGHLTEGSSIKTTCGQSGGTETQAAGDKGRFRIEGNGVLVGSDVNSLTSRSATFPVMPMPLRSSRTT